jgi:hypothetical protein
MNRNSSRHVVGLAVAVLLGASLPSHADEPTAPAPSEVVAPSEASASPGAVAPGEPGRLSLELTDLDAELVAQRLGAALGAEVRVQGPVGRRVTVKLAGLTPNEALDRVVAAFGGSWKRAYQFTQGVSVKYPTSLPTGLKVSLNLNDTSCRAAAIIAAKAAGGQLEVIGELSGRVTLVGKEIPVEQAMAQIAEAAGAVWRPVYTVKVEAAVAEPPRTDVKTPEKATDTPIRRIIDRNRPIYDRNRGLIIGPDGRRRYHNQPKERRTRNNTVGYYGAKPKPVPPVDVERLEKLSRLGSFAGIFSTQDAKEREQRILRFRQALQTQAERLEAYRPQVRVVASRLTLSQLEGIVNDAEVLSEEQRKEVAPILDYVDERIKELKALTNPPPAPKR